VAWFITIPCKLTESVLRPRSNEWRTKPFGVTRSQHPEESCALGQNLSDKLRMAPRGHICAGSRRVSRCPIFGLWVNPPKGSEGVSTPLLRRFTMNSTNLGVRKTRSICQTLAYRMRSRHPEATGWPRGLSVEVNTCSLHPTVIPEQHGLCTRQPSSLAGRLGHQRLGAGWRHVLRGGAKGAFSGMKDSPSSAIKQ
jgi:hypothetical protein